MLLDPYTSSIREIRAQQIKDEGHSTLAVHIRPAHLNTRASHNEFSDRGGMSGGPPDVNSTHLWSNSRVERDGENVPTIDTLKRLTMGHCVWEGVAVKPKPAGPRGF